MMTVSKIESITYRLVVAISVFLLAALLWAVLFFGGMSDNHDAMLHHLQNQSERLDALKHNKAKATAKRWTSDDTMELIACLEIPYAQRGECLARIQARFQ